MHGSMRGFDSGRSSRRRMRYSEGKPRFRKLDHEPLSTTEDVPELLKEQVEALLETGEEIKISISTDLRFDGAYGKDWLLITNRRLIAFNQNDVLGHNMREVPLSSVEGHWNNSSKEERYSLLRIGCQPLNTPTDLLCSKMEGLTKSGRMRN